MKPFSLKKNMRIGVAGAATQIEGGVGNHSWMDWYQKGHIKDATSPARANDHYRLWQEDAALMRDLGLQVYRLGVEWARVEPTEGCFDQEAVKHYVNEVKLLQSYGIQVLVTLHHFTNPMWFEQKGAFQKKENIVYFIRFVNRMVAAFGAGVHEYITINEPNVYATNGYYFGIWPPGCQSFVKTVQVMSNLVYAHIRAYKAIHRLRRKMGFTNTKVSFANHVRVFAPKDPTKLSHRFFAKLTEHFFQGSLSKAMMLGHFQLPLYNTGRVKKGFYCDFIAVNYYTRSSVAGLSDGVQTNVAVNDLGWEIYAPGIVTCAQKLHRICPLPIYITENGTCDNSDTFRSLYIYEHIRALCKSSLPIKRYYHWCFCDNFEWVEGESARFGIVHVDYATQKRTVKESGLFLRDLIKNDGVNQEMINRYSKDQKYRVNDL